MAYGFENATIDAFNADLFLAYRLESAVSDVIVDDSGDSNDGINFGTDDATGKNNQCREWVAANDDYIQFPDDLLSGLDDLTINCWVNIDSLANSPMFLVSNWVSPHPIYIDFKSDGRIRIDQGVAHDSVNVIVTTLSWQMVTFVKNGTTWKIYKNGVWVEDITSGDYPAIDVTSGHDYYLGIWGDLSTSEYDGRMDEPYIWDTNISAAAITALYNGGAGRFWHEILIQSVLERTGAGLLLRTVGGVLERT